eukprot:gene6730-biopygen5712
MATYLKSPFFLTQALAPALRASATHERPAKVINIASIDGIRPNPQETYSYQASKSGLIHLTRRVETALQVAFDPRQVERGMGGEDHGLVAGEERHPVARRAILQVVEIDQRAITRREGDDLRQRAAIDQHGFRRRRFCDAIRVARRAV